mgnify:CR=1 FL=1
MDGRQDIVEGVYWLKTWISLIALWIARTIIKLILKTSKIMLRGLAKKIGRMLAPVVLREIVNVIEEITKIDINQDGKIGK